MVKKRSNKRKSNRRTDNKEKDANKTPSNVTVSVAQEVVFDQDPVISNSSSSGNQEEDVDKTPSANGDGDTENTPKRAKIADPEEEKVEEEEEDKIEKEELLEDEEEEVEETLEKAEEVKKVEKEEEPEEEVDEEEEVEDEEEELLSLSSGDEVSRERDDRKNRNSPILNGVIKGTPNTTGSGDGGDADEPEGVNSTSGEVENEGGQKPEAKANSVKKGAKSVKKGAKPAKKGAKSVKKVAKSGTPSASIPKRKKLLKVQVPAATPQRRSGRYSIKKVDDDTLREEPAVWSKIEPNAKVFARWSNATYYSGTVERKATGEEVEEGEDAWIIIFDDGQTHAISTLHILPLKIIGKETEVTFLARGGCHPINGTVLGQQLDADGGSEGYVLKLDGKGKDEKTCASRRDICFDELKANKLKLSKEYKLLAVENKSGEERSDDEDTEDEDGVDGDDEDEENDS